MSDSVAATPLRVLLVDDDDVIAGSLRHYLMAQGVAVDSAIEAGAAIPLMTTNRYGVVLVDPYLTGEAGRSSNTLISTIRQLQPAAKVIVLTGYTSPSLLQIASESSLPLLQKPQSVLALSQYIVGGVSDTRPDTNAPPALRSLQ